MVSMSLNVEIPRRNFGDNLQLNNCILYLGLASHMTLEISDFVTDSLVETD